jgi:disulfide oxidoreductase YuzD
MEPISLILAALGAGAIAATKGVAGSAVKDAYEGLKTLMKRKFEGDPFAQGMVDAKPKEIEQVKGMLIDKIKAASVDQDQDVVNKAKEIKTLIDSLQSSQEKTDYQQTFDNEIKATNSYLQQGNYNTMNINSAT